jgi:predicted Zn finger-like uncharacterized protein
MYTTCSRCETQLTVTVAGLRSGQGFVRCSRCGDVFNALPQLAEDGEGTDIANATGSRPALQTVPDSVPAESEHVSTGTFQTIVLEGDGALETEEIVPETELDAQIKEIAGQLEASQEPETSDHPTFELDEGELDRHALDHAVAPTERAHDVVAPDAAPEPQPAAETDTAPEIDAIALLGTPASVDATRRRGLRIPGTLAVLLLVVGAAVHLFRQDLVEQAWAARPLIATYRLLHVSLEPRWDITAYEVRQLGAEVTGTPEGAAPSRITVRASIHNHASRPQPTPMLRIALQDRFGQQLTTRMVAPEEYLRDTQPGPLGADQRRDVSFTLPDPGQGAVGFEIEACLRDAGGVLLCSNDPPAH